MAEKSKEKQVKEVAAEEAEEFRVEDRRHWAHGDEEAEESGGEVAEIKQPTLLDEYRQRAEAAEKKLQEYIEAFKRFKEEHEQFRLRLTRDVDRKVELNFGELVGELLESMDDLDLALDHVNNVPEAEPLARGVELARKRFLSILERNGVQQVSPEGSLFDPNEAEAVRVDDVESPDDDGKVTQTLRPGYRLGERVIRAARVAVGRFSTS
jgi:molecular chaperone GrpE